MIPVLVSAPSPLAGEGGTDFQQTRLGEGVSTVESGEEPPHPAEPAARALQPSPATGYTRFRSHHGAAEVGNIRLRLAEGTNMGAEF
jgi:hypothetical protein